MEFCDKCGGLMIPRKAGKSVILECRKCGSRKKATGKNEFKLATKTQPKEEIVVVEKENKFEVLPKTDTQCPKCENMKAYWWMQQTRSADEPPTRFFRCTKCKYVWREYE